MNTVRYQTIEEVPVKSEKRGSTDSVDDCEFRDPGHHNIWKSDISCRAEGENCRPEVQSLLMLLDRSQLGTMAGLAVRYWLPRLRNIHCSTANGKDSTDRAGGRASQNLLQGLAGE
jgi:hypothetical protein